MSSLPCKCSYFHEKVVYTSAPIFPYDILKMERIFSEVLMFNYIYMRISAYLY